MKHLSFLALLLILIGCTSIHRGITGEHMDGSIVRSGILKVGIHKLAFLDVWGEPTRAATQTGNEVMNASWGAGGGKLFKGNKTLEVWNYEDIGTVLVFDRDHLAAWKTDRTVAELKAAAKVKTRPEATTERPANNTEPAGPVGITPTIP